MSNSNQYKKHQMVVIYALEVQLHLELVMLIFGY